MSELKYLLLAEINTGTEIWKNLRILLKGEIISFRNFDNLITKFNENWYHYSAILLNIETITEEKLIQLREKVLENAPIFIFCQDIARVKKIENLNQYYDKIIISKQSSNLIKVDIVNAWSDFHQKRMLQQRIKQLNTLHEISVYIQGESNYENMITIQHAALTGITADYGLGFNRAALFLIDEHASTLRCTMAIGHVDRTAWESDVRQDSIQDFSQYRNTAQKVQEYFKKSPLSQTLLDEIIVLDDKNQDFILRILNKKQTHRVIREEIKLLPRILQKKFAVNDANPIIMTPLINEDINNKLEIIGLIIADKAFTGHDITSDDIKHLETFANAIGIAINRKQQLERMNNWRKAAQMMYNVMVLERNRDRVLHTIIEAIYQVISPFEVILIDYAELNTTAPNILISQQADKLPRKITISSELVGGIVSKMDAHPDSKLANFDINLPFIQAQEEKSLSCYKLNYGVSGTVGLLIISYLKPQDLTTNDEIIVDQLVQQVSIALGNNNRFRIMKTLYESGKAIVDIKDERKLLQEITRQAIRILDLLPETMCCSHIYLYNGEENTLNFMVASHEICAKKLETDIPIIHLNVTSDQQVGIIGLLVQKWRADGNTDHLLAILDDPHYKYHYIKLNDAIQSQLAVILHYNQKLLGVLSIEHVKKLSLESDDIPNLKLLAAQAGVALHNINHLQVLQKQADIANNTADMLQRISVILNNFSQFAKNLIEDKLVIGPTLEPVLLPMLEEKLIQVFPNLCEVIAGHSGLLYSEIESKRDYFEIVKTYGSPLHNRSTSKISEKDWHELRRGAIDVHITTIKACQDRFSFTLPYYYNTSIPAKTNLALIPIGDAYPRFLFVFLENEKSMAPFAQLRQLFNIIYTRIHDAYILVKSREAELRLDSARERFILDVVHQLIGSLSGFRSLATYISQYYERHQTLPPNFSQKLQTLVDLSGTFQGYVKNYDLLSKLSQSESNDRYYWKGWFRDHKLISILIHYARSFQGKATSDGVLGPSIDEASFENFPQIELAENLFATLILNLYDNAVKYSVKNQKAPVNVKGRFVNGAAFIYISNYSAFPLYDHEIEHIFKRYRRTQGAMQYSPIGTGTGLFLAKKIVELHNGAIKVEPSKQNSTYQGSHYVEFQITLPVKQKW